MECPSGRPLWLMDGLSAGGFVCPLWLASTEEPRVPLTANWSAVWEHMPLDMFVAAGAETMTSGPAAASTAAELVRAPPSKLTGWAGRCAWRPAVPPSLKRLEPASRVDLAVRTGGGTPEHWTLHAACDLEKHLWDPRQMHTFGFRWAMLSLLLCMGFGCVVGLSRHRVATARRRRISSLERRVSQMIGSHPVLGPYPAGQTAQMAEDAMAKEAREKQTMERLLQLPVSKWQQLSAPNETECALCMEAFDEADVLRLLPCGHSFHCECVDHWFGATKYQVRTCPLCKADPLVPAGPLHSDASRSEGALAVPEQLSPAPSASVQPDLHVYSHI